MKTSPSKSPYSSALSSKPLQASELSPTPSLSESFAEKIFAPFQRLHGRSEYKGTGIGLAVCRRIVERHNGKISAQSTPGEGTLFTIVLPIDSEPFGSINNSGDSQDDA